MSFDIFISSFNNCERYYFPCTLIEKVFESHIISKNAMTWQILYPDGKSDLQLNQEPMTSGFVVNRPSGSIEFYQGILDILQKTPSILYWPGDGCVIADPAVIQHLPSSMVEALGTPTVVTKPEQIIKIIINS